MPRKSSSRSRVRRLAAGAEGRMAAITSPQRRREREKAKSTAGQFKRGKSDRMSYVISSLEPISCTSARQPIRRSQLQWRSSDVASFLWSKPELRQNGRSCPPPSESGRKWSDPRACALTCPSPAFRSHARNPFLLRPSPNLAIAAHGSRESARRDSLSTMATKVVTAASSTAKAILKLGAISRPWEQQTIPPSAKYGGRHTVTMIPGDGIGPELMLHVKSVFRHACVPVDFEEVQVNSNADEEDIRNAIMAIRRNRVALKGNIETNHNLPPSYKSRNNILRTSLDLYANVIHCKSLPGVVTRHKDIDILIVRENTEGEYSSLEHESVSGVVESLKIITKAKSLRIAEYAFRLAQETGRKKVTAVHKANIMKLGDGLFLQCCKEVASGYPNITFESMIVDNTTMQLVSRPQQFDVMVMPNLYGNIVNNVCAGLVGGPGLVAGANYGHVYAVFETATRNTGKSIANKNIANPTATLLASCMMLDHLKLHSYASSIRKAVLASMDNENMHTPDIGGQGTTSEAIQDIIRHIRVINGQAMDI
uniref:Isocitrate dehydrogenase [NAD] subunit, mitochondrial n=2 Tax=Monodelphis domestica TaxID=13616 RepID=F7CWN0_MONDO